MILTTISVVGLLALGIFSMPTEKDDHFDPRVSFIYSEDGNNNSFSSLGSWFTSG